MAKSSLTLWIDVDTNRILDGWNSNNEAIAPTFVSGDITEVKIHLVRKGSTAQFEELPTANKFFKLAIGKIDAVPDGGFWTLAYGGSQVDFDYNETASSVQSALNLIPEIIADGGVTVTKVNGDTTYRVAFNNKVAISSTFSTDASNLLPSSIVQKNEVKVGSSTTKAVWHFKPKQIPVAYQPVWTQIANNSIATLTVLSQDSIRASIEPDAPRGGTYTLSGFVEKTLTSAPFTVTTENFTTTPISAFATESEIDAVFPNQLNATSNGVTVKKVGEYAWDLSFSPVVASDGQNEYDVRYVIQSITTNAILPFYGVSSSISLNNYETVALLAGLASADAILEVEMTENGVVTTVLQTSCKIVNDIIGQHTYSPIPFDDPVTQSELDNAIAGLGDLAQVDDAPSDGSLYARQDGAWVSFTEEDNQGITQTEADARYAQIASLASYALLAGADFTGSITTTGRMAIGGGLAVNPANKLAIYNGNVVFSAGYGIAFGDGTTLTTAPTPFDPSGYATESWVTSYVSGLGYLTISDYPITSLTSASYKSHREQATSTYTHEYFDSYSQSYATIEITVTAPAGLRYDGWSVLFTDSLDLGVVQLDEVGSQLRFGVNATSGQTMQDAIGSTFTGSGSVVPSGWALSFSNGGSPYNTSNSLAGGTTILVPTRNISQGYEPILEGGVIYDLTVDAKANAEYNKLLSTDAYGNVGWTATSSVLSGYALLSGATFTGKVNTVASNTTRAGLNIPAGSAPTSPTGGDFWFQTGGNYLYYRSTASANTLTMAVHQLTNTFSSPQIIDTTSNTLAGLRVTQKGTFPALVVEDATNPDTTAFVVNANGFVGIGRDPATWTPATNVVLDVNGKAVFSPINANTPSLNVGATACNSVPTGATAGDIWITNVASPKLAFQTGGVNYYCVVANQFNTFTGGVAISGNTASNPQLAITQAGSANALTITTTGTGKALVVEDATSPDTTATVIDNAGNVGIGVNPATWVATEKLEVQGNIKFSDNSVQSTAYVPSNVAITGGTIDNVVIDGGTY